MVYIITTKLYSNYGMETIQFRIYLRIEAKVISLMSVLSTDILLYLLLEIDSNAYLTF